MNKIKRVAGKAIRVKCHRVRAPYRTWTLKDVLPHVIETDKSFKNLKSSPIVENFSIHKLVEKVGEAALLYLCHKTLTLGPDPDENFTDQEMDFVGRKFYEHIVDTVYEYEKNRRLIGQTKKPKRGHSKGQDITETVVTSTGGPGKRKLEFIKRKPMLEYDRLIKTEDIYRAVPITVPKKPSKKER